MSEERTGISVVAKTETARMKHEELLALYASGWTPEALSERFGYSRMYVNQLLREPEYLEIVRGLQRLNISKNLTQARDILKSATSEAMLTLIHLMRTSTSDTVRARCAETILDRAGFAKAVEVNVNENRVVDEKAARLIADVMKESIGEIEPVEMIQDSAGIFRVAHDGEVLETQEDVLAKYGGYGGPPA